MTNTPSRQLAALKTLLGNIIGVPVYADCDDKPKPQVIRNSNNLILRGASLAIERACPLPVPLVNLIGADSGMVLHVFCE